MPEPPHKEVDPRMHSAEHLLTAALMKRVGCGRPFTTHIEKKKSKADYALERDLEPGAVAEIEREVNEVIRQGVPVQQEFLSRAEAEKLHNLGRLPPEAGDQVRIIRIGEYDACPCIGPHVANTEEIGAFHILSTTYENGALRVRFKVIP